MPVHPLIPPALALVGGILLGHHLSLPWPPFIMVAALLAAWVLWRGGRRAAFPALPVWGLFFCLGAALIGLSQSGSLPVNAVSRLADNRPCQLVATMADAPEPAYWGGWRSQARALEVDGKPVQGLIRLTFDRKLTPPGPGERFSVRVRLKPILNFANPGGFDYADYMAQQGIRTRAHVGTRAGLTSLGPGEAGPGWWVQRARAKVGRLISGLAPGPGRALLRALVLGQRGEFEPGLRDAFGGIGVAHLLAISGLHMGLVWGLAYLLLRYVILPWPGIALRVSAPKLAAFLAFLPAIAYGTLAGGSTPTIRALVMAGCLVAALLLDRPYRPSGGLALAALVICLIWPQAPLSLSFQLSFTAVAAILLAASPLAARLEGRRPLTRALGAVAGFLVVSAVVGLAVWPLAVLDFHQLPLLSLLANGLLVPLVGMIALPLALAGAGLGLAWPAGGALLLAWAQMPANLAVALATSLAAIPGAMRYVAGPGPWAVALIYASALIFLLWRQNWGRALGGLAGACALALWILQALPPAGDGKLTVWVLDVGQGLAVAARTPTGQAILVDGGGFANSGFDPGQRVVAPFLWSQGLDRLALLACSHRDADHSGGLAFITRWFHPQRIWTNGGKDQGGAYGAFLAAARHIRVSPQTPAQIPLEGELGGARIRLLWPPATGPPAGLSENDCSLVLVLGLGQCWVWLPGDIGPKVERLLAPMLSAQGDSILVAPHHGGRGSSTRALLKALKPQAVVIPSDCLNFHGWVHSGTLARLRAAKTRILGTASGGCIKLETDGNHWRITQYLQPPRTCPGPG